MENKKGKSLKKEPYILHQESKNREIPFKKDTISAMIFKTNLTKIIKDRLNYGEFGFEHLYQVKEKYTFNSISKKLKDFIENTSTGKKFSEKKTGFSTMLFHCLGWEFKRGILLEAIFNILFLPMPILIKYFIEWLESPEDEFSIGMYYAGIIGSFYLVGCLIKFVQTDVNYYGKILGKASTEVIFYIKK